MKQNYTFLIILLCFLIIKHKNALGLKIITFVTYIENRKFYKIMDSMAITQAQCEDTDDKMKKCVHVNVGSLSHLTNKNEKAIEILKKILPNVKADLTLDDICLVDVFDFTGSYFPSAHTDLEWVTFQDAPGFQVWYLNYNKNENNYGNMFLLENDYLYKKYSNTPLYLRAHKNKIRVLRNVPDALFTANAQVYDEIPLDQFKENTKVKYLNYVAGDCLVFSKGVIHMSDYRGNTKNRQAINFRVIIKNKDGSINFRNNTLRTKIQKHHVYNSKEYKLFNVGLLDFA